jgi:hypothetical protein
MLKIITVTALLAVPAIASAQGVYVGPGGVEI